MWFGLQLAVLVVDFGENPVDNPLPANFSQKLST